MTTKELHDDVLKKIKNSEYSRAQLLVKKHINKYPSDIKATSLLKTLQEEFKTLSKEQQYVSTFESTAPEELTIEISGQCNLNCEMCIGVSSKYYKSKTQTVFKPNFSELTRLISFHDTIPNNIYLCGHSEPLMSPLFKKICTYLDNNNIGIRFLTNGTLLDDAIINFLSKINRLSVGISFDGANSCTFNTIRKGADFNIVLNNIQKLIKALGQKNKKTSFIGFNFCAMKKNITDLPQLIQIASDLGLDNILVHHLVPQSKEMLSESLLFDKQKFDDVILHSKSVAKELGINFSSPDCFLNNTNNSNILPPWQRCIHPWSMLYLQRFKISICCTYILNQNMNAGTLKTYRDIYKYNQLNEIWNSKPLRNLRLSLLRGEPTTHCLNCVNFPYDEKISFKKLINTNQIYDKQLVEYIPQYCREIEE
jgi:MoaA/NifB/PqqE/SkfB family radical SAM enzyme